ncbi:DUF2024 family protein [Flavobacterium maritimum]
MGQLLSSKECRFCHIEIVKPQCKVATEKKGCYIYEIQNCN